MSESNKQVNPGGAIQVETMPEIKHSFLAWVKSHKKQLILAGIGVGTLIGIILGIKNKDSLEALWASLAESVKDVPSKAPDALPAVPTMPPIIETAKPARTYTSPAEPFDVSQHIRTMAAGRHHSAEKAAEAAALGIDLRPNQTLVDAYTKCAA